MSLNFKVFRDLSSSDWNAILLLIFRRCTLVENYPYFIANLLIKLKRFQQKS